MGQIIKYNVVKSEDGGRTETVGIGVGSIISSGGGGNNGNGGSGGNTTINANCNVWGQPFNGADDITGTLKITDGDLYVKKSLGNDDEEEWDEDEGEEETGDEELTDGGNVYVEGSASINENLEVKQKITAAATEAEETFGKKLFLNYPTSTSSKTNVADLIKANADGISKNKTDITNLTSTVNNHTTQINTNQTNISNNTAEINDLKNTINNFDGITEERLNEILNNWKYGAYSRPVILATGKLRKSSITTSSTWFWEGITLDSIISISNSYTNGLMTLNISPATNARNIVYSVHATQMKSGDTGDNVDNPSIKGRSDGAHWFETRFDNSNNKVYIREFHQGDGNNDTWYSDYWGGDGGGIKEVAITIIGYAYFTNTIQQQKKHQ